MIIRNTQNIDSKNEVLRFCIKYSAFLAIPFIDEERFATEVLEYDAMLKLNEEFKNRIEEFFTFKQMTSLSQNSSTLIYNKFRSNSNYSDNHRRRLWEHFYTCYANAMIELYDNRKNKPVLENFPHFNQLVAEFPFMISWLQKNKEQLMMIADDWHAAYYPIKLSQLEGRISNLFIGRGISQKFAANLASYIRQNVANENYNLRLYTADNISYYCDYYVKEMVLFSFDDNLKQFFSIHNEAKNNEGILSSEENKNKIADEIVKKNFNLGNQLLSRINHATIAELTKLNKAVEASMPYHLSAVQEVKSFYSSDSQDATSQARNTPR